MRLELLHEHRPLKYAGLPRLHNKLFAKQRDANIKDTIEPVRTGNQNAAINNPRHRDFMNTPPDGASIESGQARKPMTKPNQRPTVVRFGQNIVPGSYADPLNTT